MVRSTGARWTYRLAVVAAAAAALIALPWERGVVHEFNRDYTVPASYGPRSTSTYTREDVTLDCHGTQLHAWLYLPQGHTERCGDGARARHVAVPGRQGL